MVGPARGQGDRLPVDWTANQEDEDGNTPQQQALEAMLDIMYARQAAGDDAGVLEVAAKIAKCK